MNDATADATTRNAFERKYQEKADPWDFAHSAYERGRYATILRAFAKPRYACIYEPGCSVGVLTERLSRIAARVVATDFAPSAVEQARHRCAGSRHAQIEVADVRHYRPTPPPDLIVFSEIGYYFPLPELSRLGIFLAGQLMPGGELVAAHWLGYSEDHVLHGDAVHEELRSSLPLRWLDGSRHGGFRIDRWRRGE
jgi:trans-aconitate methyltransferase